MDGFSMEFYQVYWDIVKLNLTSLLREFHSHGKISSGEYTILVALFKC